MEIRHRFGFRTSLSLGLAIICAVVGGTSCNQKEAGTPRATEGVRPKSADNAAAALAVAIEIAGFDRHSAEVESAIRASLPSTAELADLLRVATECSVTSRIVTQAVDDVATARYPLVTRLSDDQWAIVAAGAPKANSVFVVRPAENTARWHNVEDLRDGWNPSCLRINSGSARKQKLWTFGGQISFGTARSLLEHRTFTFLNLGQRPITIKKVEFSCGCATGIVSEATIQPSAATLLRVTLDITGKRAGALDLKMRIRTDATEYPDALFRVSGNIRPPVKFEPSTISVGDISPDSDTLRVKAAISTAGAPNVAVRPYFLPASVRFVKARRESSESILVDFSLDVRRVTVDSSSGRFEVSGVLTTDREGDPLLQVAISGRRLDWITIAPRVLFMGSVGNGAVVTRNVSLKMHTTGSLTVETLDKNLTCVLENDNLLKVTWKAPEKSGVVESTLILNSGGRYAVLPIVGTVREEVQEDRAGATP